MLFYKYFIVLNIFYWTHWILTALWAMSYHMVPIIRFSTVISFLIALIFSFPTAFSKIFIYNNTKVCWLYILWKESQTQALLCWFKCNWEKQWCTNIRRCNYKNNKHAYLYTNKQNEMSVCMYKGVAGLSQCVSCSRKSIFFFCFCLSMLKLAKWRIFSNHKYKNFKNNNFYFVSTSLHMPLCVAIMQYIHTAYKQPAHICM